MVLFNGFIYLVCLMVIKLLNLFRRRSRTNQATGTPETGQPEFFHVVVAASTAILACEYLELMIATVARLDVVNCVFNRKTVVFSVNNKFF